MIRRTAIVNRSVQDRDARVFVIAVEGATTEPSYFHSLQENDLIPRHRVKLHIVFPDNHASAPWYVLGAAEGAVVGLANFDETWLVFDLDEQTGSNRREQIIAVTNDARKRGWGVALSCPSFELWLLLHAEECGLDEVTGLSASVERLIRSAFGEYTKNRTPAQCLRPDAIAKAIERARKLDPDPRSPIPVTPATRVYQLIERLMVHRRAA